MAVNQVNVDSIHNGLNNHYCVFVMATVKKSETCYVKKYHSRTDFQKNDLNTNIKPNRNINDTEKK